MILRPPGFLGLTAAGLLAAGAVSLSPSLLAAGTFVFGLARFLDDYRRGGAEEVDVISIYAFSAGVWFGLANLAGYLSRGTGLEERFYTWQDDRHIFTAQCIATLGAVVPVLADPILRTLLPAGGRSGARVGEPRAPARGSDLPAALLACLAWGIRLGAPPEVLQVLGGRVVSVLTVGPVVAIFLLVSDLVHARSPRTRGRLAVISVLVLTEFARAAMRSDMRTDLLSPFVAAFLPLLLARALRWRHLPVALAGAAAVVLLFEPMATARTTPAEGTDRARLLVSRALPGPGEAMADGAVGVVSRLSTFNQLSRVAGLVEDRGTKDGETLAYLAYVFIPRVVWPDKPTISPGREFARELGRGTETESGWSNAVNMTVPGEFYLNFRWLGVIAGMVLVAAAFRLARFSLGGLTTPRDITGRVVAFFVVTQAMTIGSHAGAVVNLVLWWIFLLAGRRVAAALQRPSARASEGAASA